MADEEILLLAKRIETMNDRLDQAWEETDDPEERRQIVDQMDALSRERMRLMSINIRKRGAEYDAATDAIGKANVKLRKALQDEASFVAAMEAVSQAIDLISSVKAA